MHAMLQYAATVNEEVDEIGDVPMKAYEVEGV